VETGTTCQWCGIGLTGKVGSDGRAQLAPVATAQPSRSRYLLTAADGTAKVFDTRSEAMVQRAIGGGDIEVI
jgi:hypothetical protein